MQLPQAPTLIGCLIVKEQLQQTCNTDTVEFILPDLAHRLAAFR